MAKPPQRRAGQQPSGGGLGNPLTLALFLLLAGFFAFLVGISEFDGGKQESVLRSVAERFDVALARIEEGPVTGDTGQGQASAGARESIARLFERELAVAQVDVLRRGERLEIVTPAASLFRESEAALKDARQVLVERVADALASSYTGGDEAQRFAVELVMADPAFEPRRAAPDQAVAELGLSVRRTSRLAQALRAAGAPEPSVGVGLAEGEDAPVLHWRFRAQGQAAREPLLDASAGQP